MIQTLQDIYQKRKKEKILTEKLINHVVMNLPATAIEFLGFFFFFFF